MIARKDGKHINIRPNGGDIQENGTWQREKVNRMNVNGSETNNDDNTLESRQLKSNSKSKKSKGQSKGQSKSTTDVLKEVKGDMKDKHLSKTSKKSTSNKMLKEDDKKKKKLSSKGVTEKSKKSLKEEKDDPQYKKSPQKADDDHSKSKKSKSNTIPKDLKNNQKEKKSSKKDLNEREKSKSDPKSKSSKQKDPLSTKKKSFLKKHDSKKNSSDKKSKSTTKDRKNSKTSKSKKLSSSAPTPDNSSLMSNYPTETTTTTTISPPPPSSSPSPTTSPTVTTVTNDTTIIAASSLCNSDSPLNSNMTTSLHSYPSILISFNYELRYESTKRLRYIIPSLETKLETYVNERILLNYCQATDSTTTAAENNNITIAPEGIVAMTSEDHLVTSSLCQYLFENEANGTTSQDSHDDDTSPSWDCVVVRGTSRIYVSRNYTDVDTARNETYRVIGDAMMNRSKLFYLGPVAVSDDTAFITEVWGTPESNIHDNGSHLGEIVKYNTFIGLMVSFVFVGAWVMWWLLVEERRSYSVFDERSCCGGEDDDVNNDRGLSLGVRKEERLREFLGDDSLRLNEEGATNDDDVSREQQKQVKKKKRVSFAGKEKDVQSYHAYEYQNHFLYGG